MISSNLNGKTENCSQSEKNILSFQIKGAFSSFIMHSVEARIEYIGCIHGILPWSIYPATTDQTYSSS